ncbi:hypothetical protein H477_0534 [[Clostridium] sordellii ATCC 9714]|nr:hypothetical protein H477_0534 [[Clostridium] sordellii ATCC 9714] [Paeniclostridium sordellii ATCC 9714]
MHFKRFRVSYIFFYLFPFFTLDLHLVNAVSGTASGNSSGVESLDDEFSGQLLTELINASSSDKTAKKVAKIFKSLTLTSSD